MCLCGLLLELMTWREIRETRVSRQVRGSARRQKTWMCPGPAPPGTLCGTGNRNSESQSVRVAGIAPLGEAFPVGVEQAVSSCPEEVHGWPGVSTEITWAHMGVALRSRGRGLLAGARALCMTLAESSSPDCGRGRRACVTPHQHRTPHCSTWGCLWGGWVLVDCCDS